MPKFGKRTPLTRQHFSEFEAAYGSDPYGKANRTASGLMAVGNASAAT